MTRDEFIAELEAIGTWSYPDASDALRDAARRREETILDQCRAVINAEIDYRAALHAKVGSKYGADRYGRNLEAARARRDRAAKELGL